MHAFIGYNTVTTPKVVKTTFGVVVLSGRLELCIMEITLDITKVFNSVINYVLFFDSMPMNPILFVDECFQDQSMINCSLMNFTLNYDEKMERAFVKKAPHFDDILACAFLYKDLFIYGKAKISVSKIKAVHMVFKKHNEFLYLEKSLKNGEKTYIPNPDLLYYTFNNGNVEKGDILLNIGGNSSFSEHLIDMYMIADKSAKATITFSSNEYIVRDAHDHVSERKFHRFQTPYNHSAHAYHSNILAKCTNTPGEVFDYEWRRKIFAVCDTSCDFEVAIYGNCDLMI